MVYAYIGLGANLGDPPRQIREALDRLAGRTGIRLDACSSLYRSRPMGPQDQPAFANAAARLETQREPLELLDILQTVERGLGRDRSRERHWGPRTLDLDLLLYGNETLRHPRLSLPHPGLTERAFVVVPLLEIAPELTLPDGRRLAEIALRMPRNGLRVWEDGYTFSIPIS